MDHEYLAELTNARDKLCGYCDEQDCTNCVIPRLINAAYNELAEE